MEVEPFIRHLPKVELHVHIEGTLTPHLRWTLAQKNRITLPFKSFEELKATYATWDDDYRKHRLGAKGLGVFLEQYYGGMEVLHTESDFYELGMAYFEKASLMEVRHAEVFFDPQAHTRRGVPLKSVMEGLKKAKQNAQDKFGLTCDFILCFLRDMSPESAEETYTACLPWRDVVYCAIGLDSNEHQRPPSLFDAVFCRARKDGFKLTSHCDVGQENTHEHIRQVVSTLAGAGLDRIDHGLSAAESTELVDSIKQRGLGMTLCPHAYFRRWPDEEVFPVIRHLFDAGVKITINSDDPTYMHDMWLVENMQLVRTHCRFTDQEMVQLVSNAIDICWAKEERKLQLRRALADFRDEWLK